MCVFVLATMAINLEKEQNIWLRAKHYIAANRSGLR